MYVYRLEYSDPSFIEVQQNMDKLFGIPIVLGQPQNFMPIPLVSIHTGRDGMILQMSRCGCLAPAYSQPARPTMYSKTSEPASGFPLLLPIPQGLASLEPQVALSSFQ